MRDALSFSAGGALRLQKQFTLSRSGTLLADIGVGSEPKRDAAIGFVHYFLKGSFRRVWRVQTL